MAPFLHNSTAAGAMHGNGLRETFAIDLRSLALLRVGAGLLLLADLAQRAGSLTAHYTDAGVLPRALRREFDFTFRTAWWTSPHMLCGSAWFQGGLFGLAALAAVALLVGYRTRAATAVSLFLLLGVQARHPLLLQGGDTLLRCLLFWGLFVPLGAAWSVTPAGRCARRGHASCRSARRLSSCNSACSTCSPPS